MNAKFKDGQSTIEFPRKPSWQTRDALKRWGYRWHPARVLWQLWTTPDAHAAAVEAIKAASTAPAPRRTTSTTVTGYRSHAEAQRHTPAREAMDAAEQEYSHAPNIDLVWEDAQSVGY